MGQQHRAGLGVQRLHMFNPVILFIGPRQLMTLDAPSLVRRNRSTASKTGLGVAGHVHAINKICWARSANHDAAVDHGVEILGGTAVYFRAM